MMAKPKKILWVDDDAGALLAALRRRLEHEGIEVDVAQDVPTALHRIEAERYDALLIDLILPSGGGLSSLSYLAGIEVIRSLRGKEMRQGQHEKVPVVILSVINKSEVSAEIRDLGAEYFDKISLLTPDTFKLLVESLGRSGSVAEPEPAADD
jgi:DNA-binding response OmpR family regulator